MAAAGLLELAENFVSYVVKRVLEDNRAQLETLGADIEGLEKITPPFNRLTYTEAVEILTGERAKEFLAGQLAELNAMFESFLPTISCPYLSLHGRTPAPGYRGWLEGLLANGSFALMAGQGHYPFLADPAGFVQHLRAFHHSL